MKMTADSLKSFITLPPPTSSAGGGYKRRCCDHSAKLLCFSIFLAVFCVTISCYELWNLLRTNELRSEVGLLRDRLEDLRKRVGLDLYDDLEEFETNYDPTKGPAEDDVDYDENQDEDFEDLILSEEYFAEDDDDIDIEDEETVSIADRHRERIRDHVVTASNIDFPYDDEDDDYETGPEGSGARTNPLTEIELEIDDDEDDTVNGGQELWGKIRTPREAVPMIDESYALRRNRTHPATDDAIHKFLLEKRKPRMQYDWTEKRPKSIVEHRAPPMRYVQTVDGHVVRRRKEPPRRIRHPIESMPRHQHPSRYQGFNPTAFVTNSMTMSTASPVHVRQSRVMRTNDEDKSKAFRQVITKREYERLKAQKLSADLGESVGHPEMVVHRPTATPRRRAAMRLTRKSMEEKGARPVAECSQPIAIQYNGNAIRYEHGGHSHYFGNELLRHQGGIYHDWTPAPWVRNLGMSRYFSIDLGTVTVKEAGLYYIYAQIYYKDEHDTNGFVIRHNADAILQCSTMTHSTQRISKVNSCYSGAMHYVQANDTLRVVDLGNNRNSTFGPSRSYFGLVRFGDHRAVLPPQPHS